MDDEGAARRATQLLIAQGHRHIGMIGGASEYSLSQRRIDGWRDEMARSDLSTTDLLVPGNFTYDSGLAGARALLERDHRPSAIISSNDQMALATLDVATQLGLTVPADLSIISFDNTAAVRYAQPPITAVRSAHRGHGVAGGGTDYRCPENRPDSGRADPRVGHAD